MSEQDPPDGESPEPEPDPEPGATSEPKSESEPPKPDLGIGRLDPHRAAAALGTGRPTRIEPVIDTRRYQWMIGIVGLVVVIVVSAYLLISNGVQTPGIPAGGRLHDFVAPLATSAVNKPANANPHCNPAKPNPKGLNICGREPLVLDFFVTGSGDCVREVNTLQKVSTEFPHIEFAAVAVRGSLSGTAALERSHHWTIPIGVDEDGRVGEVYGVEICPMIELARTGGVVAKRLVGDNWLSARKLAAQVRVLANGA
ncbi:MAG TPA: hypothetical protein VG223_10430 [Solirubrobacteraceae bacterium]|nr:hypothetical protein [Solirubrobacteraceae bacterium]